jgi:hypothetical protein
MEGIIKDLDFGYMKDAKSQGKHVLQHFSDLVIGKLAETGKDAQGRDIDVQADVKAHVDRTLRRFKQADDGSLRAHIIKEHASDTYGLSKELAARGINPKRDTGAKFFTVTANTPLFPQFIASSFIEGRISAGLVDLLSYADVQIDRLTYDKVRLNDVADDRRLRNVGIGSDLPLTELSQLGTNVPMRKYGRRFIYAREVVSLSPLDIVSGFLRKLGRQVAVDETDEALEILHAGDGETGSAVTDTTPATDGTLVYNDLVKLELVFGNSYAGDVYVSDATNFQTILTMSEYKDPLAQRGVSLDARRIPSVPTPSGMGRIWRWSSTNSTYMAETGGRIAAADSSQACYTIRNGDVMEEFDTHIQNGKNEVALSYLMAVVKGDPSCFASLDVTA